MIIVAGMLTSVDLYRQASVKLEHSGCNLDFSTHARTWTSARQAPQAYNWTEVEIAC